MEHDCEKSEQPMCEKSGQVLDVYSLIARAFEGAARGNASPRSMAAMVSACLAEEAIAEALAKQLVVKEQAEPAQKKAKGECMGLFSSESGSEGHPDKLCEQVSDGGLDACLAEDPKEQSRVRDRDQR